MKQSDKEFICYLICLSWDRLDDSERIRASKIIREITGIEDKVQGVCCENRANEPDGYKGLYGFNDR